MCSHRHAGGYFHELRQLRLDHGCAGRQLGHGDVQLADDRGGWDFANVFSGASLVTNSIGPAVHSSGSDDPGTITGVAAVQYITDWSYLELGTGFSATLTC